MSDLLRLKEDASDFERRLLDSAVDDIPSPEAKQRTLALLGVMGAGGAITGAAAGLHDVAGAAHNVLGGSLSVGTAGTAGGASMTAGKVAAFALMKWLISGAFTVVVAVGAWHWTRAPKESGSAKGAVATRVEPARVPVTVRTGSFATLPQAEKAPATAVKVSSPEPVVQAAPMKSSSTAAKKTLKRGAMHPGAPKSEHQDREVASVEPATASVLDEVASLDRARHALANGSPAEALTLLTNHERRYASGTLAPEARVLRIRALLQLGRRDEAQRLADEFLALHPRSPHAAQVRDLLNPR